MTDVWVLAAAVLSAALTGAGGAEIIKAILARTKGKPRVAVHAESEVSLARQAQAYAQSVEADAREARSAAQEAWRVVHGIETRHVALNRKLDQVQYNVSMLSRYVDWLVELIRLPSTTIEEAREAVTVRKPPTMRSSETD